MATYRYRSQHGRIRAVIDGEWSRRETKKGHTVVRIYNLTWQLIVTIHLAPGEKVRKVKNRPNVCSAHKLPLERGKKTCGFVTIEGLPVVECVPVYDRALQETKTKAPKKGWVVHSVGADPMPGIQVRR